MNDKLAMNAAITYDSSSQGLMVGSSYVDWPYYERWEPIKEYHHETFIRNVEVQTSTTEQAFNIVSKLIEKKYVEKLTVKKFIELVNEVSKII